MLGSKDSLGFLKPLAGKVRSLRTVTIPGEPNALSAAALAEQARHEGLAAAEANSVAEAVADLSRQPGPARLLICGSLYLAGTVLAKNG
jgi:dihydrofolate synthase/folylpolyglutamate synthase